MVGIIKYFYGVLAFLAISALIGNFLGVDPEMGWIVMLVLVAAFYLILWRTTKDKELKRLSTITQEKQEESNEINVKEIETAKSDLVSESLVYEYFETLEKQTIDEFVLDAVEGGLGEFSEGFLNSVRNIEEMNIEIANTRRHIEEVLHNGYDELRSIRIMQMKLDAFDAVDYFAIKSIVDKVEIKYSELDELDSYYVALLAIAYFVSKKQVVEANNLFGDIKSYGMTSFRMFIESNPYLVGLNEKDILLLIRLLQSKKDKLFCNTPIIAAYEEFTSLFTDDELAVIVGIKMKAELDRHTKLVESLDNGELRKIVHSFIGKFDDTIFNSTIITECLKANVLYGSRAFIPQIKKEDFDLELESDIDEIVTMFDTFTKLIEDYVVGEKIDYKLTSWLLMLSQLPEYYSKAFTNVNEDWIRNLNNVELEYIVGEYMVNSPYDFNDDVEIGKLVYFLVHNNYIKNTSFYSGVELVKGVIRELLPEFEVEQMKSELLESESEIKFTLYDVDMMDGIEFEHFVCDLFNGAGYKASVTKQSNDQGLDVIASKNNIKWGIQTKRYDGNVTNTAVQEVVAGVNHYKCDRGMVVTNSFFTNSAKELAKSNKIILWDRVKLEIEILKYNKDQN